MCVTGAVHAQLQEPTKALVDFNEALKRSPRSTPALVNAAMSQHLLGDVAAAWETYLLAQKACDAAVIARNTGAALLCMGKPSQGAWKT